MNDSVTSPRPTLGVVLAAGAGLRFGGPKIAAAQGEWLVRSVAALQDGGCDIVAVTMGALAVDPPPGVAALLVPNWSEGMSASVRAAVAHAHAVAADRLVLHLVDLPDVTGAVVRRVLDAPCVSPPAQLARATYADRLGHPVVLGADHFTAMLATLQGEEGARLFLASRPDVVLVECGDLATGADIDTPGR